jgi:hypothetical protein
MVCKLRSSLYSGVVDLCHTAETLHLRTCFARGLPRVTLSWGSSVMCDRTSIAHAHIYWTPVAAVLLTFYREFYIDTNSLHPFRIKTRTATVPKNVR